MGFSYFNPNPEGKQVGDCTVRAIAKATGKSWDETYVGLCLQGLKMGDMMRDADDDKTREAIRRCMEQIDRA